MPLPPTLAVTARRQSSPRWRSPARSRPRQVERLLRPLERLRADRTGQRAGLGLAIVQAIADAHVATLAVRPPGGGGLEVEIEFPAAATAGGTGAQ